MKKVYIVCILSSLFLFLIAVSIQSIIIREDRNIKVGFVYVGDEMTPYTENFIKAQRALEEKYGDKITTVVKYNVNEEDVYEPLMELVEEQCDYIICPSYGYGPTVKEVAKQYPAIEFCVPTGDNANKDEVLTNYHNCMGEIYQGRYICGVVAGMKLKEMIDDGIITPAQAKIGYVAAFPYSEVISGYTSFYLGVQSVVPEATMMVKYTDTWSNYTIEKKAAEELIDKGCILISQHSDTTGPAVACENHSGDVPVYHVGYNQSMTEIAPASSLVSCTVDYSHYFDQSVKAIMSNEPIETVVDATVNGQDTFAGFDKGWIKILDVNKAIAAPRSEEMVKKISDQFATSDYKVFVGDFTGTDPFDPNDKVDLSYGYEENKNSSSPTFHYVLDDVITVIE